MDKTIEALARAYKEVTEISEQVLDDIDHTDPDFKALIKKHNVKHTVVSKGPNSGYDKIKLHGKKDDIKKVVKTLPRSNYEALDPVDQGELKGSHADRKDKDINNDGKVTGTDKYLHNRRKTIKKAIKKSGKDDPTSVKGETATMNPKSENKSTTENVSSADKKPEVYVGPDGKKHTRMVSVDREVIKKESTDMSIREKLLSVVERKDHGNVDNKQPYDDQDSPGAKKMRADTKDTGEYQDLEKETHDDASKAGRVTKTSPANPTDTSATGDKNVINPVKDTTKVGKGSPEVKEQVSLSKSVKSIASSYASMYQPKQETEESDDQGS